MIIIHGDHQPHSREYLAKLLAEAKSDAINITRLDAETLTADLLEVALGKESLFGEREWVVIEGLHSLPVSNRRKSLIEVVSKQNSNPNLLLWEKKALTAAQLKKFAGCQIQEFKIKKLMFEWLDSLTPKTHKTRLIQLFHDVSKQEDVNFAFLMLARQMRLLIQTKENIYPLSGSPYTMTKLRQQAQHFTLQQLLTLHHQLLEIDLRQKTGRSHFDLNEELDLWLLSL